MEARGLTSKCIEENYTLIKVGSGTGLTQGKFKFTDGVVETGSFLIKKESPDVTEFMTYNNQLLVHPVGVDEFANEKDTGAAVYLVDKCNHFHCIGIVLCPTNEGVLVTPLKDIIQVLGEKIDQILELVTFDSQLCQVNQYKLVTILLFIQGKSELT